MKHKLLFSTALVAASLSFAAMANADDFYVDGTEGHAISNVGDEAMVLFDNRLDGRDLGTLALGDDKAINGQVILHDKVKIANGKEEGVAKLTVNNFLTQTTSGSDLSAIGLAVTSGAVVLANDLTIGDTELSNGVDISLYYAPATEYAGGKDNDDPNIAGYAENPKKTLTISEGKTLKFLGNSNIRAARGDRDGDTSHVNDDDSDIDPKTSLRFDGKGKVNIAEGATLTIQRKTVIGDNVTVEGEGSIDLSAEIMNSGKIANNINISDGSRIENSGELSGTVTVNSGARLISTLDGVDGKLSGHVINDGETTVALSDLTGTIANAGTLNLFKGGTLKSGIITGTGAIKMSGDFTLGEDVTLGGTNNVDGTLDLGDNTLTGSLTLADGSALAFNWNKGNVDGTVTLAGKADLKTTIASGTEDGKYTFASSVNTDAEGSGWNEVNNSLYNITLNDGNNTMTIEKKANSEIAQDTGANANQAAAISAVIDGADTGNAAFDNVANNINDMLQSGDAAQVQAALDTITAMSPEAAPVATSVASETIGQIFGAISTRMSGGSIASANQGMSSGDSLFEKGAAWVQTLVNRAKLKQTADNGGFKSNTAGIALGFEKQISDDVKAGIGYAYNDGEVKSAQRKSDVDTHTAFAYGEYKPSNWFINGMLSHSWTRYDEKTAVSTAKHDADAIGLQVLTGYDFAFDNTTVTPEIGLRYVHVKQDSYSNSLGANIGGDKSDILTGVFGATVAQNWNLDNGMILKPEARLAFTYDMKNDAANATVLLPNGSSYTVDGKALKRFGVEAGLGLTAEINDHIDLTLGYEGRYRDDYRDHTGLLNAKYKF